MGMNIYINENVKDQMALITFFCDQFKVERDYILALNFICAVCGDFELDPEITPDDLKEIVQTAKEKEGEFTFEISEEGIEVNLEKTLQV
ncbi:MAG: hypothetical protein H6622_11070 [Halobacteriovoraceae bacterium]|nr:hypothetical protein [Halobacteriovoraceae bacterium]